jgi:hypothetical protein
MFYVFRFITDLLSKRKSGRAEPAAAGAATSTVVGAVTAPKPFTERRRSPAAEGPLRLLAHQVKFDLMAQFRNPRARFFTIVFPLILLFVFNGVFGDGHTVVRVTGSR